jgi:hypothetical protein
MAVLMSLELRLGLIDNSADNAFYNAFYNAFFNTVDSATDDTTDNAVDNAVDALLTPTFELFLLNSRSIWPGNSPDLNAIEPAWF